MRHRTLGRTGLSVSEISLGTVEIGLDYGISSTGEHVRPSEDSARELLHLALDLGVNLIDTARAYGESEEIIGRALSGRRNDFILATKVQSFSNWDVSSSERKRLMEASIEESLQKLRTDVVDLLLLHSASPADGQLPECIQVLSDSKRRGQARWIGNSVYGPEAALVSIREDHYDCLQIAWSALDRRAEQGVVTEAEEKGVGLIIRSVLMRGALTHRWRQLPETLEPVRSAAMKLEQLARENGMELPELAYRYILSTDGSLTALVGTARRSELEAAVRYSDASSLPADLRAAVRNVHLEDPTLLDLSRWPAI